MKLRPHDVAAIAWREALLDRARAGQSIKDSLVELHRSNSSYEKARKAHPQWAAQVSQAIADARADGYTAHYDDKAARKLSQTEWNSMYLRMRDNTAQIRIADALQQTEPGALTMVNVFPEVGKDLGVFTRIPTPSGWTTMGEIQAGDFVFGPDGLPTRVIGTSRVFTDHRCYEVTFSDGTTVTAGADHQWIVRSLTTRHTVAQHSRYHAARSEQVDPWFRSTKTRKVRVLTTAQLIAAGVSYATDGNRPNHAVPVPQAFDLPPDLDLPLDPYLLGCWLGDGATNSGVYASADDELVDAFRRAGFDVTHNPKYPYSHYVRGIIPYLRKAGIFGDKHIPDRYLRASTEQRWALLEGLMDTDGHCDKRGHCEFTTTLPALRDGTVALLRTLGVKFSLCEGRATIDGRDCGPKWRIGFIPRRIAFRLPRKAERQLVNIAGDRDRWRKIVSIEPVETVPTRCISVEHPSHSYVFGEQCLVTHNTTAVMNWVTRKVCEDPNHRIALVSASQNLTRDFVGRLERRLTDTAQFGPLIARYGPFMEEGRDGKPWAADRFTVWKSTHDEADPTVQALGWSSLAYGRRIDTLVIDDVQSRRTLSQTQEIYDNLRSTYFSRGKEMRIFVVGTRVGIGDIYERMQDDDIVDKYIVMPCATFDGEPTVPEAWDLKNKRTPRENMDRKRKLVQEDAWHANYQQNPRADEVSTFAAYLEGCLDRDRPVGQMAA